MDQAFLRRRALLALPLAAALPGAQAQTRAPVRLALIEGLSGPFANAGEAVFRNLLWAVERVNAAWRRAAARRRAAAGTGALRQQGPAPKRR